MLGATSYPRELPMDDDINRPETEEDGTRAGALRRLRVIQQSKALMNRTQASPAAPSPSPSTTGSVDAQLEEVSKLPKLPLPQ